MSYPVKFSDYAPPPRAAGFWTSVQMQEAAGTDDGPTGAWATIDTALVPAYGDPANPPAMTFATDLATLETGWFRLRWLDDTGDESSTAPLYRGASITPALMEVASLISGRLYVGNVRQQGFTAETEPTAAEARRHVAHAESMVTLALGDPEDLSPRMRGRVRSLVALRAARSIARALPAQTDEDDRQLEALNDDFDETLRLVREAIESGEVPPPPGEVAPGKRIWSVRAVTPNFEPWTAP